VKYGYARVSTVNQAANGNSLEAQKRELENAGAEKIYIDHFDCFILSKNRAGTPDGAPAFYSLMVICRPDLNSIMALSW
jgi:DNA invertase Pin-like site-specific DNA recombinase